VVGKYTYVKKTDNVDYENNDVGEVSSSVSTPVCVCVCVRVCVCVCVCARARALRGVFAHGAALRLCALRAQCGSVSENTSCAWCRGGG
jgi:hypothetical protein